MGQIFGTDGIRGIVGQWPLVPDYFLTLGQAVGKLLRETQHSVNMVVGRDTRKSGQMLQSALVAGLLSQGVNVVDLDVIPTSGVAWLIRRLQFDAGAVISASHNPVDQNGVKFINIEGLKFPENLENEIENLSLNHEKDLSASVKGEPGHLRDGTFLQDLYKDSLLSEHQPNMLQGLRILVDCANGAASHYAPEVFSQAGADVIAIHSSPSGSNINQDCGSEFVRRSPEVIYEMMKQSSSNFGVAFDGDADRVVLIDEAGNLIDGDHMLGFLGRYLMHTGRLISNAVVTTQMRNTGLKSYLENLGILVFETSVGDKYVVEKIQELRHKNQVLPAQLGLGGEQAGHIDLINEEYTTGDGIRTALFVIQAYLESGSKSLSEFAAGVGKTPQIIASAFVGTGMRLDRNELSSLEQDIISKNAGLVRVNLRYSGTEPLFRTMIESDGSRDEIDLARIAYQISREIQNIAGVGQASIDILNCTRGGVIKPELDWWPGD